MNIPAAKIALMLILPAVCSCGHSQHGIRVYDKVSVSGTHGISEKTALMLSINADIPGLQEIPTPMGPIKIDTSLRVPTTTVVTNAKGEVIGTNTGAIVAGLNTSEVTRAQGEADKSRIKETAAGVTGAALSFVAPAIAAGGVGAASAAIK